MKRRAFLLFTATAIMVVVATLGMQKKPKPGLLLLAGTFRVGGHQCAGGQARRGQPGPARVPPERICDRDRNLLVLCSPDADRVLRTDVGRARRRGRVLDLGVGDPVAVAAGVVPVRGL